MISKRSGKKKTNKHKHFRRDGVRDKRDPVPGTNGTPPRDKMGPVPGTKWDPSLFNSPVKKSKIAILYRLSLGRVGVCPWDDCPPRAVRKMFMCFLFIGFFLLPKEWYLRDEKPFLAAMPSSLLPRGLLFCLKPPWKAKQVPSQ